MRRAALYAASQVIQALHPSQVASAVTGGDETIAKGLDWIREWALGIAENDVDSETSTVRPPPHIYSTDSISSIRACHLKPF